MGAGWQGDIWRRRKKEPHCAESFAPVAVVSKLARRHEMSPQHPIAWRKTARDGQLALPADEAVESLAA
jgi:transposase